MNKINERVSEKSNKQTKDIKNLSKELRELIAGQRKKFVRNRLPTMKSYQKNHYRCPIITINTAGNA